MKFLVIVALVLWMILGVPKGTNAPTDIPLTGDDYYLVNGRYYDIDTIAYIVGKREGSPSCGIKYNGKYAKYPTEIEARLDCRDKLKKYLDRMPLTEALKYWKSVPPFQPYINDIISILERY